MEGSAEHSIIRSKSPASARSSALRTSPWRNSTPAARNRGRASSLPRRRRLSNATTVASGRLCLKKDARFDPTKPAPPVTKIRITPPEVILIEKEGVSRDGGQAVNHGFSADHGLIFGQPRAKHV